MTRTLALVICLCSIATAAHAQTDPATADELFRQGRAHVEKGEWTAACPKFAESQRLDPAAGTLLNLADCEEHVGQLASALAHWNEAIDALTASDDRLPGARARRAELLPRVPRLTIVSRAPSDARISRDGIVIGAASLGVGLPMNPGAHAIVVTRDGHKPRRYDVTLVAGEARSIDVEAGEVEAPVAVPAKKLDEEPARRSDLRKYGWFGIGVGAVGIATGAVFGALTIGRKRVVDDHCDAGLCDDTGVDAARSGRTWSTVSTVSFIAGGVLLAGGLALVIGSPDGPRTTIATTPNGAFIAWTHSF